MPGRVGGKLLIPFSLAHVTDSLHGEIKNLISVKEAAALQTIIIEEWNEEKNEKNEKNGVCESTVE